MKVVISVKPMQTGSKNRGIGAYTRELVHALHRKFPHDKFIPTSHDYYSLGADLVHFPFFDPYFRTLPIKCKIPTVVTIHDLIPLKYPEHFPAGLRGKFKLLLQKRAVRCARMIITDSVASKKDIVSLLGVPAEKVAVVLLAPASDPLDPKLLPVVKKEYRLPDRFILFVGDINWNKNIPGLVKAFGELKQKDVHLVLVGKAFVSEAKIPELQAIETAIKDSGKEDMIHRVGYVPSHHLPAIFKQAALYVQPSWDEGFGLPILEAMRVGCPVASSSLGSLPEVGGEAAAYFDPGRDMAEVLDRVLSSPKELKRLSEAGSRQVKKFTWARAAILTRKVYEQALSAKD